MITKRKELNCKEYFRYATTYHPNLRFIGNRKYSHMNVLSSHKYIIYYDL